MLCKRPQLVIAASIALIVVAVAATSAMAQSAPQPSDTLSEPPGARPIFKPINLDIEAPSLDFMKDVTKFLNDFHDEYRRFKKELRRDYRLPIFDAGIDNPAMGDTERRQRRRAAGLHPVHQLEPVHKYRGRIGVVHLLDAANPVLDQGNLRYSTSPARPDHPTQCPNH